MGERVPDLSRRSCAVRLCRAGCLGVDSWFLDYIIPLRFPNAFLSSVGESSRRKTKTQFHGGILRMNCSILPANDECWFVPGLMMH